MNGWREYWISTGDPNSGVTKITKYRPNSILLVCQIAKVKGSFVIGSAGSKEKLSWLINNACIDYAFNYKELRDDNISKELRKSYSLSCSEEEGIDLYFDNVGGKHLEVAFDAMKTFGTIVLCGMISQYNTTSPTPSPSNIFLAITKRLRLQGFIVRDHYDMTNQFLNDMTKWVKEGKIEWKETIFEGLENSKSVYSTLQWRELWQDAGENWS